MKNICGAVAVVAVLWLVGLTACFIIADYQYENQIGAYWSLSVKASTIDKKIEYLDRFVSSLDSARLSDYSALVLHTPDNSVEQNKIALKSLQSRMHQLLAVDPNSFQYQQAMQQITGQEQGEADEMLTVFSNAWFLENHFFLWDWIGATYVIFLVIVAVAGAIGFFSIDE